MINNNIKRYFIVAMYMLSPKMNITEYFSLKFVKKWYGHVSPLPPFTSKLFLLGKETFIPIKEYIVRRS